MTVSAPEGGAAREGGGDLSKVKARRFGEGEAADLPSREEIEGACSSGIRGGGG